MIILNNVNYHYSFLKTLNSVNNLKMITKINIKIYYL